MDRGTWLAPEERAYPHGGQTRKGRAIFPDGQLRRVWAGIPDTYFSVPAHARIKGKYVRGSLTVATSSDDYVLGRTDVAPPDPEQRWWIFTAAHNADAGR